MGMVFVLSSLQCHLEKIPGHLSLHAIEDATDTSNERDGSTETTNEDLSSSSSSSDTDSSSDSDSSSSDEEVKETLLSNEDKPPTPS